MLLTSNDIINYMRRTNSEWPEFRAWVNARKNRPAPLTLADIGKGGGAAFALFAARALEGDRDAVARKLALAFALGSDQRLEKLVSDNDRLADAYNALKKAILNHSKGEASNGELWDRRWAFAVAAEDHAKGATKPACQALIGASAPYPWGAAIVAHRRAVEAAKAIARSDDPDGAAEREEAYHLALIEHVCGQADAARAAAAETVSA